MEGGGIEALGASALKRPEAVEFAVCAGGSSPIRPRVRLRLRREEVVFRSGQARSKRGKEKLGRW